MPPKPSLVLPNLNSNNLSSTSNLSTTTASTSSSSNTTHSSTFDSLNSLSDSLPSTTTATNKPISKRPPLTITSIYNPPAIVPSIGHNRNNSVSSYRTHKSNGSLTLSTGTTPSSSFALQPNTYSPETSRGSLYPTTNTISLDLDDENGGRITDPIRIIEDIQAAMNGIGNTSTNHHLSINNLNEIGLPSSIGLGVCNNGNNRSRSGSSTSIRPILVRKNKLSDHPTRSVSSESRSKKSNVEEEDHQIDEDHHHHHQIDDTTDDDDYLQIEFDPKDLEVFNSLGEGAGGEVKKVLHKPSGLYMAKKAIPTSPNPSVHKQILRELAFNREVANGETPWIVKYYGAFLEENDTQIAILLEFCEGGSLESIYKKIKSRSGRIGEKILGKVAESVLSGLNYLHMKKIIHRDIKPSNILVTKNGEIKLCDLGVSGELIGSLAGTFMGTSAYMAPERIRGEKYSITSDVWSLGLSLLELALNRFPLSSTIDDQTPMHPFELLQTVITFQMPSMNEEIEIGIKWTKSLQHFLTTCLDKDPNVRPIPKLLLTQHPWIIKSQTWTPDLVEWLCKVWDWPSSTSSTTNTITS